ncbi:repeat protein [Seminavis robusta]|uniref:Repeat protein n=1 Tax=Seminavis robusta TaxID=568900 RepID=A0A9N8DZQ8_9STRA|nr:repeat protein [Seminavis robusta]|eukprot:Sro482_g151890.1 repeat protein (414) ;mRNA; f:52828-54069
METEALSSPNESAVLAPENNSQQLLQHHSPPAAGQQQPNNSEDLLDTRSNTLSPMIPVASELTAAGGTYHHRDTTAEPSSMTTVLMNPMLFKPNNNGAVDMDYEVSSSSDNATARPYPPLDTSSQTETREAAAPSQQNLCEEIREHAMDEMRALNYSAAEELFRYLLHLEHEQQADDEQIIATLANIAKCCECTGRLEEAMSCYKDALLVKENKNLRNESQSMQLLMASILYEIGMIHCQFLMEASTGDGSDSSSDDDDDDDANDEGTDEQASQQRRKGKERLSFTKAMKAFTMSLKLRTQCLGPEHQTVSNAQFNIANLLTDAGMPEEAIDYHHKALVTRRKVMGPQHPAVASSLRHLAMAYNALGHLQQAENVLNEALEIVKRIPFDGTLQQVMIELSNVRRKLTYHLGFR